MSIAEGQAVVPANSKVAAIASQIRELCDVIVELDRQSVDLGRPADIHAANWHRSLFQHIKPRVEGQPYLLVAVVGGTNTGKSTIFNQLAGSTVSRVLHTACGTKHPVCIFPRGFWESHSPERVFPGFKTRPWQSDSDPLVESSENLLFFREDDTGSQPSNLLLLDTPDIDGCLKVHWDRAQLVRQAADVLVGALTEQKYNDAAVVRFFREAAHADKAVMLAFNKIHWPDERGHCDDWLQTFRSNTDIDPLGVYAVPYAKRAGKDDLRLPFYPLSQGATDLRKDLTDLKFEEIALRTFRGSLRQLLDDNVGIPGFLHEIQQKSEEYAKLEKWIAAKTRERLPMPEEPPGHVIMDEVWEAWNNHRYRVARRLSGVYSRLREMLRAVFHGGVATVDAYAERRFGKDAPFVKRTKRLEQVLRETAKKREADDYKEREDKALRECLAKMIVDLESEQFVGSETVKHELDTLLSGLQQEAMFKQARDRHARLDLVSDAFRQFIEVEVSKLANENPKTLRALKAADFGVAMLRPVLTLILAGGPHGLVTQLATHSFFHVAWEVTFATAGDMAATGAADVGVSHFVKKIAKRFYEERGERLAEIVEGSLPREKLDRISRLAQVQNGEAMQKARRIVNELKAFKDSNGLGASRTDDRVSADC